VVLVAITAVDWQSGVLLLAMLPLVPLFMALVGVTTKRRVQRQYLLLGRLAGQFMDLLRGLTTLRIYGQAERQERTLEQATERYRRETLAALRITFLSSLVLDLVAALSVAVVAVDIGLRLDHGSVSFLTALVVLFLAPELFAPLRAMGAQFHASEAGVTASTACLELIAESPSADNDSAATVAFAGTVVTEALSVSYESRDTPALLACYLGIQPGESVALIGESGAGKSTLLAALLGFTAPSRGSVLVGVAREGQPNTLDDLADLDADAWRRNVAWLPQRPVPTQATVADEVRLGDPSADDEQVARACADCAAPDPATTLGEDGRWVSAGQRRRIALARVLLRVRAVHARGSVPLVLLDEPSEDLDRETELVVANVITALRGSATVLMATHSELLAGLAQRRVTLADGRVVGNALQQPRPVPHVAPALASPARWSGHAATAVATPALRLRDVVRAHRMRSRLSAAAALAAGAGLAGLALTATSTWLISRAAQHPNVQALAIAVVGVRTFAIARALLRYAERLASHDAALRLLTLVRVRVFAALRPLGGSALGGVGRGDLLRRFVGDVDGVQDALVRTVIPLIGAGATALGAVVLAALLAPAAGLTLAIALTLSGVLVPVLCVRLIGEQDEAAALTGERDARTSTLPEGLGELVAYGAATRAVDDVAELDARIHTLTRRPAFVAAAGTLASGLGAALALPGVLWCGAAAIRAGRVGPVELAVLAVCVLVSFEGVAPIPSSLAVWARCRAGLARVGAVLSAAPAVPEPDIPASIPSGELALVASDLAVAPAPEMPAVLRGIELDLRPGRRIAVVGSSGCGKSTLLATTLRQLPATQGSVAVTNASDAPVRLCDVPADDLPAVVAGSLQGDHVFDATLRDNLRVVRPDATDAELDAVAARVGLGPFLASLPRGWSTPAGSDGSALSGGQRQRLLLARALLADPAILVLDEPTAHLDAETERAVLADLLDATAGRTVLLSTHRRLPLRQVDEVIEVGSPRQQGSLDPAPVGSSAVS